MNTASTVASSMLRVTQPMVVIAATDGNSPIGDDLLFSWNTTPTSSLGAASPLDSTSGSMRHSAVETQCGAALTTTMEERRGMTPNMPPTSQCATVPPSPEALAPHSRHTTLRMAHETLASESTLSPVRSHSAHTEMCGADNNNTTSRSMPSDDDDDEVVGVTADGELLFRKRDGGDHCYEQRPLSRHHVGRSNAPSPHRIGDVPTLRPTPHRTQPRPTAVTVDNESPVSSVAGSSAVKENARQMDVDNAPLHQANRQLFSDVPTVFETPTVPQQRRRQDEEHPLLEARASNATRGSATAPVAPEIPSAAAAGTTDVIIPLTVEDIRFAQLAMRSRDRENDVYAQHVQEDFSFICRVAEERRQRQLTERFHRMAWDLRRF